jgi:acetyl-CoA acyltransferase 1
MLHLTTASLAHSKTPLQPSLSKRPRPLPKPDVSAMRSPLKVKWVDPKTEQVKEITVSADDGVRDGVTAESLSKLKPAFKKDGSTHAGNASQVSDGAAAVLLARRSTAKRLGLPIVGKFVAAAVAGVPPRVMGIGPAFAIPKVLKQTGLKSEEVDFFEINEAFASQAVYSIEKLGLPYEKVNLNGGAIAIGHPLGMSEFFNPVCARPSVFLTICSLVLQ